MTARLHLALLPVAAAVLAVAFPVARPATAQEDGDPERGREVFTQSCAMCHGDDAGGMAGMHPSLRGAVDRLGRDGVEVTVSDGRDVTPPMPAFEDRLTGDEIADVVAYIDSLPSGPRQPDGDGMDGNGMGDGMGDMMDNMTGGGDDTVLWVTIAILAAVAAGLGGYVLGRRRGE